MTIKNPLTEITFALLAANHKRRYEKSIKDSQNKIGPYVYNPQTEINITSTSW